MGEGADTPSTALRSARTGRQGSWRRGMCHPPHSVVVCTPFAACPVRRPARHLLLFACPRRSPHVLKVADRSSATCLSESLAGRRTPCVPGRGRAVAPGQGLSSGCVQQERCGRDDDARGTSSGRHGRLLPEGELHPRPCGNSAPAGRGCHLSCSCPHRRRRYCCYCC